MSVVKKGSKSSVLQLQPDWDLNWSLDQTITGSASYKVDAGKAFSHRPKIGDSFEKLNDVKVIGVQLVGGEASNYTFNVQLFGLESNPTKPLYSYYSSLSEEAIETHPDFEDFAGSQGSEQNGALFSDDGLFLGFESTSSFAGVRGFLTGTPVIRRTWYTTNVYKGLEDIGDIYKIQSGKIPGLPAGINALKTSWNSREVGANFHELSEEFLVSGPGGWNDTIYSFSDSV